MVVDRAPSSAHVARWARESSVASSSFGVVVLGRRVVADGRCARARSASETDGAAPRWLVGDASTRGGDAGDMPHTARARAHAAFSAYRFGTDEEFGGGFGTRKGRWARDGSDDHLGPGSSKWRESRLSRAWTRMRATFGDERLMWILVMIVLFIGRRLMSDKPLKVPSPSRGIPVLRRTVSERRVEPRVGGEVDELVIVPGHAVYLGSNYLLAKDDSNWALESYQLLEGEAKTFMEHMELGIKEVAKNPNALLLFSGGKTRSDAGAISEASSYWQVSKAFDWFGVDAGVQSRVFTEEHARDSFENLFFSVNRFYELTQRFPKKITVVGFRAKRERFEKLHLNAIAYPEANFTYIGTVSLNEKEMEAGEAHMRAAFQRDPYGCRGELAQKRVARNPFNEGISYGANNKLLSGLWLHMNTCSQRLFKGPLPWSKGVLLK